MSNARGIDVTATRFPELMTARRLERGLSKADLAERAGLSAKVIHQIESRSRGVFLEKTLMLAAEALDASLEELLQPLDESDDQIRPPQVRDGSPADAGGSRPVVDRRRRRRLDRRHVVALAALVLLAVAAPMVVDSLRPARTPHLEVGERSVQAWAARSDRLLWTRGFEASVVLAGPSPWADGTVLVGLGFDGPDGGRILLLDGKTGRTRWDRSPDAALAASAFGAGILAGLAAFQPLLARPVDLDGDGEPELAVSFIHVRNYPSSVLILDRRGEVRGEYFNRGHVYDMLAVDLDGDGRQELVCVGAHNREPYHGGTVFILDHRLERGASVDPVNGGGAEVADHSRSRILLPAFEPQMMAWLETLRLSAWHVMSVPSPDGEPRLLVTVGADGLNLHLLLDAHLVPLAVWPNDDVRIAVAGWPVADPETYGPNCPLWREQWLRKIVRVTDHDQGHLTRR